MMGVDESYVCPFPGPALPRPLYAPAMFHQKNALILTGGQTTGGSIEKTIYKWQNGTDLWELMDVTMAYARVDHVSLLLPNDFVCN